MPDAAMSAEIVIESTSCGGAAVRLFILSIFCEMLDQRNIFLWPGLLDVSYITHTTAYRQEME